LCEGDVDDLFVLDEEVCEWLAYVQVWFELLAVEYPGVYVEYKLMAVVLYMCRLVSGEFEAVVA